MAVPVLFIIFNRQEIAIKTFERIRAYKPDKLYIASDGARTNIPNENEIVCNLRKTISAMIDWECEVKYLFREKNIGCSLGVSTAINWLFDNEEQGVILEDDCKPQLSFFRFCEEMLDRYKDDQRIGMIDGANYISGKLKKIYPYSYYFSKYKIPHGWATWRRAWKNFDLSMKWRHTTSEASIISNMGYKSKDVSYWKYRIGLVDKNAVSAWDWQWFFSLSANNQLTIFPNVSLISNTGFGAGATHTSGGYKKIYSTNSEVSFPLIHPEYIVPNKYFDKEFYKYDNTLFYRIMKYIPIPIKKIFKKILRKS